MLLAIIVASRAAVDEVTLLNQVATDTTAVASNNPLTESRIFALQSWSSLLECGYVFLMNGANRSMGIGKNVVVLCSLAISFIVCK